MKRTPWFDAMKDKPARVGWYELKLVDLIGIRGLRDMRWDGDAWLLEGWQVSMIPGDKWRGLAEKP
jgi:hypothetical protein